MPSIIYVQICKQMARKKGRAVDFGVDHPGKATTALKALTPLRQGNRPRFSDFPEKLASFYDSCG
jgi:hypothetical protein